MNRLLSVSVIDAIAARGAAIDAVGFVDCCC
jgi:hypothetical protein